MRNRILIILLLALCAGTAHPAAADDALRHALAALAQPLRGDDDLEPLVAAAGSARVVLLGEASHGTHEFYTWRERISRRLIGLHGFSFVAIEGDWSTLRPLDRYVRHLPDAPASARAALRTVGRWPRWVWANAELARFAEWLHGFNARRPPGQRVGIHGIDLYAVWESVAAVQDAYRELRPAATAWAQRQYRLLSAFDGDHRSYTEYARQSGTSPETALRAVVRDLARRYREATPAKRERWFDILQHARVVEAGERYLRLLPGPPAWSGNTRAAHFDATVARLLRHYGYGSRAIVWAHNTHVGDARATVVPTAGEVSLGQLARQRHGPGSVFTVGFATATGSVLAAREWQGRRETLRTPPPRDDSLEAALLASGDGDRFLLLDHRAPSTRALRRRLPHRAIGVVFDPHRERSQNYVPTRLAYRYDALVFLPRTRALDPLDP